MVKSRVKASSPSTSWFSFNKLKDSISNFKLDSTINSIKNLNFITNSASTSKIPKNQNLSTQNAQNQSHAPQNPSIGVFHKIKSIINRTNPISINSIKNFINSKTQPQKNHTKFAHQLF